jgi:NitT/TauT family transport system ATP-binding protein
LHTVLEHVDLSVQAGELVTLLGQSGSGKSSLLRIAAGLLKPSGGTVRVRGEILAGPRPDVALAFQDACLLPWLSVERNVGFGLGFKRQPDLSHEVKRQRVANALRSVGLSHAAAYTPAQLSGGMAQRVALARCLTREPRVLLLDEPFAALDEITRAEMQQLLLGVARAIGAATLLVTHDIDEALQVSDRIVLLGSQGSLVAQWPIALATPRDPTSPELADLRLTILRALHASMQEGRRCEPLQPN